MTTKKKDTGVKAIATKNGMADVSGAGLIAAGMALVNDPTTSIAGIILVLVGFGLSLMNTYKGA